MPDIAAFRGLRFDPAVAPPASATSPPYDVISPREREALEAASEFNVVRLDLGPLGVEGPAKYEASRALIEAWLARGALVQDVTPSLYVYEETFDVAGAVRVQTGVLASVEISPEILPHERTMGPVVADRLDVIRATRANISPVMCSYWTEDAATADALARVTAGEPYASFASADGTGHRAWRVDDPATIRLLSGTIGAARVVIADGHHRFRTAQAYRDERRAAGDGDGPWDRTLLYLVDAERAGPALLPIHRLVRSMPLPEALASLKEAFDLETVGGPADELARVITERRRGGRCFGLLGAETSVVATLRDERAAAEATAAADDGAHSAAWRDLDVAVLHAFVFGRLLSSPDVTFVHHPSEAAEAVAAGDASFAVLLAPTPVGAVRDIAEAGDSMPPKSTFFVPKPRTGIVMRLLDGEP